MPDRTPTRKLLAADAKPAFVPNRFREPLYHVEDDALDESVSAGLGRWLHNNRDKLARGGDELGLARFNYEILSVDKTAPDLVAPLKRKLVEAATDPKTLSALCVPEFDLRHIEMHATLYHHGSHFGWHDDAPDRDGELVPTRRLTFCYYMHAEPKLFSGGELEFIDGTTVEPKNNRLALFHPIQQHRIRRVECWSANVLSGRWALMGWVHGDAPDGWAERIPELRGET